MIILGGGGESPKRSQKITRRGGEVHQKITEDHDYKGGGVKNWPMGGSGGDIFIDQ